MIGNVGRRPFLLLAPTCLAFWCSAALSGEGEKREGAYESREVFGLKLEVMLEQTVVVGQPVTLTVRVTNLSKDKRAIMNPKWYLKIDMTDMETKHSVRGTSYAIWRADVVGSGFGTPAYAGLQPGQCGSMKFCLSRLFDLTMARSYVVAVELLAPTISDGGGEYHKLNVKDIPLEMKEPEQDPKDEWTLTKEAKTKTP